MGICASCLGLDRHPSQEQVNETDPLLDDDRNAGYETTSGDGQVDEEDLRREREELDRITNAATENMVDVQRPEAAELGPSRGSQRFRRQADDSKDGQRQSADEEHDDDDDDDEEEEEEEAAWLQSVQADNLTSVQGMQAGGLVLDVGQLRADPQHSAAKKSLKANKGN